jgi:hypothetical protein
MAQLDVKIRPQGSYELQFSASADRSNAEALEGATLSGDTYVFVSPSTDVDRVVFYETLGGTAVEDTASPFDLKGDSGGLALPWQLGPVTPGLKTMHAVVKLTNGNTITLSTTFTVSPSLRPITVAASTIIPTPTISTVTSVTVQPNTVHGAASLAGTPLASGGAGVIDALGWSAAALAQNGWHDGTNVEVWEAATGTQAAKWMTCWCAHNEFDMLNMVHLWASMATSGKHQGHFPVFTIPLGVNGASMTQVINGEVDSTATNFANVLQGYVNSGALTDFVIRMGHEFTIPGGWVPWSVENDFNSLNNFKNAYRRWAQIILAICPTAKFELCAYSCGYDYSTAYPGDDVITYIGFDIYDDWQGAGSTKIDQNPYSTYVDPDAAWVGRWNLGGDLDQDPVVGSDRWTFEKALAGDFGSESKLVGISEWGLMARENYPNGGGGDNPRFMHGVFDLAETGGIHHFTYFNESATFQGGYQDHDFTGSDMPNAKDAFIARAAA